MAKKTWLRHVQLTSPCLLSPLHPGTPSGVSERCSWGALRNRSAESAVHGDNQQLPHGDDSYQLYQPISIMVGGLVAMNLIFPYIGNNHPD